MRPLALAVALLLAAPARAEECAELPPGRAQELVAGEPAPYHGSLVDRERMGVILAKRIAAELERDAWRLQAQDAQAREARALSERGPSWGLLVGVAGIALVLGVAGGVGLVYLARR